MSFSNSMNIIDFIVPWEISANIRILLEMSSLLRNQGFLFWINTFFIFVIRNIWLIRLKSLVICIERLVIPEISLTSKLMIIVELNWLRMTWFLCVNILSKAPFTNSLFPTISKQICFEANASSCKPFQILVQKHQHYVSIIDLSIASLQRSRILWQLCNNEIISNITFKSLRFWFVFLIFQINKNDISKAMIFKTFGVICSYNYFDTKI